MVTVRYRRLALLALCTIAAGLAAFTAADAACPHPAAHRSGSLPPTATPIPTPTGSGWQPPQTPGEPSSKETLEVIRVSVNSPEVLQKMHALVARHGMQLSGIVFRFDSPNTMTWVMIYMKGVSEQATLEVEVRRPVPGGPHAEIVRITGPTPVGEGPPPRR